MTFVKKTLIAAAGIGGLALLAAAGYLYMVPDTSPPPAPVVGEGPPTADPEAAFTVHPEPRPVPELRFVDGAGRELALADFQGRVVLLNLWATWCAPCVHEMPTLDRLQAELGGSEFEVVALSVDRQGLPLVREFYDELGLAALATYVDPTGEAARALNAFGLPTTLLIDRDGDEIGRLVGPAEWDAPDMVAFLRGHLERPADAALEADGDDTANPRPGAPSPAASFAAGAPAFTALPSSDWKDQVLVLKETRL